MDKGEQIHSFPATDAYTVTRPYDGPKAHNFVFAIKSTERLSVFERASDYMSIFATTTPFGKDWIEAIREARSCMLKRIEQGKSVSTTRRRPSVSHVAQTPAAASRFSPQVNDHAFVAGSLLHQRLDPVISNATISQRRPSIT